MRIRSKKVVKAVAVFTTTKEKYQTAERNVNLKFQQRLIAQAHE